jgi:drug/metabolite transporter (DMT)-like permease
LGAVAILLWAGFALLTVGAAGIPPLEVLSLSFAIACLSGLGGLALRGRQALSRLRQPPAPWLAAFAGLFLYHALYFYALATIPPAQASLIAYLWPLLIVLLSALLPGGAGLRPRHLAGAGLGLAGTVLIFAARGGAAPGAHALPGYLAAFGCALVWSAYSVANRRFAEVPSEMLVGVCGAVAVAGALAHAALEPTVWPRGGQWAALAALGVGPIGLAFLAWDRATKRGNLPLLGALSYLGALGSTLLLVLAGQAPASPTLGLAALLIVGGAALACAG